MLTRELVHVNKLSRLFLTAQIFVHPNIRTQHASYSLPLNAAGSGHAERCCTRTHLAGNHRHCRYAQIDAPD